METKKPVGEARSQRSPGRRANSDQRKQAIPVSACIDLICIGQELRDRRETEDPHPNEEDEAQMRNADPATQKEELDACHEEKYHRHQESLARELRRDPAIDGDVDNEGKGLGGGG